MDPDDTTAILHGVFELNAKLAEVAKDVNDIRDLLVDDDEEEETSARRWPRTRVLGAP
jgi:hypothetical protein